LICLCQYYKTPKKLPPYRYKVRFFQKNKKIVRILSKITGFYVPLLTLLCFVMSDSVVDIRLDLSSAAAASQERPDWISVEV
jgi:hypothetical protein